MRLDRILTVFALVACAAAIGGGQAQGATAAQTPYYLGWSGDSFYNYDFLTHTAAQNNVDWPVTVLFTNNATVNGAKCEMDNSAACGDWAPLDATSWTDYALYMNDGVGAAWDNDGGKKTTTCPVTGDYANHYRIYGIGVLERLYNTTLGYWVPATTHRDWSECPGPAKYDFSEGTEEMMTAWASDNTLVANDKFNFYNPEPFRVAGNHTWDSNGLASTIHMP